MKLSQLFFITCLSASVPACAYEAGKSAQLDCDALAGQSPLVALKVDLSHFDRVQRDTIYEAYTEWSSATCGLVTVQDALPTEKPNVVTEFKGSPSAAELGWGWLKIPTHISLNPTLERHDMQGELKYTAMHELTHGLLGEHAFWSPVREKPYDQWTTCTESACSSVHYVGPEDSIMQSDTINRYDGYHAFLGRPDLESFCRFWMPGDTRCQVKHDSVPAK